jgi:hypothetical protein
MNAKNRIVLFSLILFWLCAAVVFHYASKNSSWNAINMQMKVIDVIPKADPMDIFVLSPDGALMAHYVARIDSPPAFRGKTLEIREVNSSKQIASIQLPVTPIPNGPPAINQLRYCDRGNYLLAIGSDEKIYVVDTRTYQLHTTIDLNPFEYPPPPEVLANRKRLNINYTGRSGGLSFSSCAANAPTAAFSIYYESGMGAIEIFNLDTGSQVAGLSYAPLLGGVEGVTVSPLGETIALLQIGYLQDGKSIGNDIHGTDIQAESVTIIDLRTQGASRTIHVSSDNYPTSEHPIAYAGEKTVAVELLSVEPGVHTTSGEFYYHYRASVHFFDIDSGSEVQMIADPNADDFNIWGMSANGRTMLAYSGKSYICTSCNKGTGQKEITDARFTLWDRESGKMIVQSPSLKVIHHECPWYRFTFSCTTSDETPVLALSQSGNAVIASWTSGGEPIKVYTLTSLQNK